MYNRSKAQTVLYIFLLTVLPQLIVIATVASVGCWAFWAVRYNTALLWGLGIIGFITMLFTFVCVSVLIHSYGLSLFAKTRKEFNFENYKAAPITRIDYSVGRRNTLTGTRPIFVRTRQISSGGPLLAMGMQAILVGLTGIFKFTIEAIRVYLSDDRQAEWEACREYMQKKMSQGSLVSFFQLPILCGMILAVIWCAVCPTMIYTKTVYNPKHIEFNITEKYNSEFNNTRIHILFYGEITNTGSKKIEQVEGVLYFKDRQGNILFEDNVVINVPFSIPSPPDDYLEKNESWDIVLEVLSDPYHLGAQALWTCDPENIEISMEISEIWYKGDKFIEFPKQDIWIVKPFGD